MYLQLLFNHNCIHVWIILDLFLESLNNPLPFKKNFCNNFSHYPHPLPSCWSFLQCTHKKYYNNLFFSMFTFYCVMRFWGLELFFSFNMYLVDDSVFSEPPIGTYWCLMPGSVSSYFPGRLHFLGDSF